MIQNNNSTSRHVKDAARVSPVAASEGRGL